MKTFKKALPILGVLFWALLLAPFFFGAQAAHPATDDFTFAVYTHPTWVQTGSVLHVLKDALSYALRTWRDWQGTVTGVIVMTLNPAVFSLAHYGAHAVVLLAVCRGARRFWRFPPCSCCSCRISWRACTGSTARGFTWARRPSR